jgi:hypothetical protein
MMMKKFNATGLTAALMAGASLLAMPAVAQDADAGKVPRLMQDGNAASGRTDSGTSSMGTNDDTGTQGASSQSSQEGGEADAPAGGSEEPNQQQNDNSASDIAPGTLQGSGEVDSATEAAPGQRQKSGEVDNASEAAPGQVKQSDESAASVEISSEQQIEIRNVITEIEVEPVTTDVEVSIGVEVPRTIELRPLPPRIIEIVPAYEGYQFFVLPDGRIVIVEPDTLEVVYILVG